MNLRGLVEHNRLEPRMNEKDRLLAEKVRAGCIAAAVAAYEDSGMSGLCAEGRWELALDAIRLLDLESMVAGNSNSFQTGKEKS